MRRRALRVVFFLAVGAGYANRRWGEMLSAQAADGQALPESTFNIPLALN